ncbi:autophagy- protein 2 [Blastocladiella emersonii ATCC 22665]|nr:autophagy- protein 2 [Blastocladiella emersonii ATCC 22665]
MWGFPAFALPANLQKRLVKFLLKRALGQFLRDDINLDQLDVSLGATGTLALRDLALDVDQLNAAVLAAAPLAAVSGTVASIHVAVPWTNLSDASCEIHVSGIHLQLTPRANLGQFSGSRTGDPTASYLAEMTNSVYIANEFLQRQGGRMHAAHSPDEDAPPPSPAAASPDTPTGLEGVQLLSGMIDRIMAKLKLRIVNTAVSIFIDDGPPLRLSIGDIVLDESSPTFFEATKTAMLSSLHVLLGPDPILWCESPIVINFSLPTPGHVVARVDVPELTGALWPQDLRALARFAPIFEAAGASRRHRSPESGWSTPSSASATPLTSDDDDEFAGVRLPGRAPAPPPQPIRASGTDAPRSPRQSRGEAASSRPPSRGSLNQQHRSQSPPTSASESDYDSDGFASAAPFQSSQANTVFYSAIHESVLIAPKKQDGLSLVVGLVSVLVALADPPLGVARADADVTLAAAGPHLRFSVESLDVEASATGADLVAKLANFSVDERRDASAAPHVRLLHVPSATLHAREKVVRVPTAAMFSDPGLADRLAVLQAAVASASPEPAAEDWDGDASVEQLPPPPPPPRPASASGGGIVLEIEDLHVTAQVQALPTNPVALYEVQLRRVRVAPDLSGHVASLSVSLGTNPPLLSADAGLDFRVVPGTPPGLPAHLAPARAKQHLVVTGSRFRVTLTRGDFCAMMAAAASPYVPPPTAPVPLAVRFDVAGFELGVPDLRLGLHVPKVELTLVGTDYALTAACFSATQDGRTVFEHGIEDAEPVVICGRGAEHSVLIRHVHYWPDPRDQALAKEAEEYFAVPSSQPVAIDPPPPAPTTRLTVKDLHVVATPSPTSWVCRGDIESLEAVWHPGALSATMHSAAVVINDHPILAVEGLYVSLDSEPTVAPDGNPTGHVLRRLLVDRPQITVSLTPESVATALEVAEWATATFAAPAPSPETAQHARNRTPAADLDSFDDLAGDTSGPSSLANSTSFGDELGTGPSSLASSRDVLRSLDDDAFANRIPRAHYDLAQLSISVVEDLAMLETELEQTVLVDSADSSSSGSGSSDEANSSSSSSSVVGLEIVDDHFADPVDHHLDFRTPPASTAAHSRASTTGTASGGACGASAVADPSGAVLAWDAVVKVARVIIKLADPVAGTNILDAVLSDLCLAANAWSAHPTSLRASIQVSVGSLEVLDTMPSSAWKKLLTVSRAHTHAHANARSPGPAHGSATPGGHALPFVRMDAVCFGSGDAQEGEWRAKVRVQPMKLHLDQDTVEAVIGFASEVESKVAGYEVVDGPASPMMAGGGGFDPGAATTATPAASHSRHATDRPAPAPPASAPSGPFFQRVEVYPISVRIDYKPKRVDLAALHRGHVVQLLNVFHLEGAEMNLRHVTVTGTRGVPELLAALVSDWLPHVRNTQLPNMVSGVGPLRSLVNIGTGVADLFLLPVEQYRRDGRLIKGLQRGAHNFVKTAAVETLSLGAKLAVGTHTLLERADTLLGPTTSSSSASPPPPQPAASSPDRRAAAPAPASSKYAHQPRDAREGLAQAITSLRQNVTQAARVIAIPVETMERDGATGAVRAVLRAVPIAVLRPMIGATDAVGKTLMGIRNDLDPGKQQELMDKYKSA